MVHVNTGALTELFSCGKTSTPVIVRLSSSELLLSKENVGIFIGPDGKPSRKVPTQLFPVSQSVSHAFHLSSRLCSHPELYSEDARQSWKLTPTLHSYNDAVAQLAGCR